MSLPRFLVPPYIVSVTSTAASAAIVRMVACQARYVWIGKSPSPMGVCHLHQPCLQAHPPSCAASRLATAGPQEAAEAAPEGRPLLDVICWLNAMADVVVGGGQLS